MLPECGKHVIQRIPNNQKKGKRQTSIAIVTLTRVDTASNSSLIPMSEIPMSDIEVKTQGGHGKGGQHQNATDSAVRMKHIPTGESVFINGRKQHQNKRIAHELLSQKVHDIKLKKQKEKQRNQKSSQFDGMGRSGKKVRTYNLINSRVVDHISKKKTNNVSAILDKGMLDMLK